MDAFFECVDAEPLVKDRLAAVIAWCKSNAIANPGCLAGISDADIAAGFDGKPLAVQAFAMRSVWAATAADKAKSQKLREMLESSPYFDLLSHALVTATLGINYLFVRVNDNSLRELRLFMQPLRKPP